MGWHVAPYPSQLTWRRQADSEYGLRSADADLVQREGDGATTANWTQRHTLGAWEEERELRECTRDQRNYEQRDEAGQTDAERQDVRGRTFAGSDSRFGSRGVTDLDGWDGDLRESSLPRRRLGRLRRVTEQQRKTGAENDHQRDESVTQPRQQSG